jgi:hypothetical protein
MKTLGARALHPGVYRLARRFDVDLVEDVWFCWASRALGGFCEIQYRLMAMRVHRQAQVATGLVVVAVLLGSVWVGVLGASGEGNPADQVTASRLLLGVEAAVLPDRAPALRPAAERPDAGGSMLLAMVLAGLAAAFALCPQRLRSDLALVGPQVRSTQLKARAPPHFQLA